MNGQAKSVGGMWAQQSDNCLEWTFEEVPTSNEHDEREMVHGGQGVWGEQASRFQPGVGALAPTSKQLWVALTFSAQGLHLSGLTMPFPWTTALAIMILVSLRKKCSSRILWVPETYTFSPLSKHQYRFFQFLKQKQTRSNRSGVFKLCSLNSLD